MSRLLCIGLRTRLKIRCLKFVVLPTILIKAHKSIKR